jgi:hypothetical protein
LAKAEQEIEEDDAQLEEFVAEVHVRCKDNVCLFY